MPTSLPSSTRIYKCPTCDWLCTKGIEILPDGTAIHAWCGAEVTDVTEEIEKYNPAPFGAYD